MEDLVRKSAGLNVQRGDQVVVTNMPFTKIEAEEAEASTWQNKVEVFSPALRYVGIFALMALILMFVIIPLIKNILSTSPAPRIPPVRVPMGVATEAYAHQTVAEAQTFDEGRSYTETELAKQMAQADSKQFADILRNWIK